MGSRGLEPPWLRLHAAHLAMLPCLSVCLSVCPSLQRLGRSPSSHHKQGSVCGGRGQLDRVGRQEGTGRVTEVKEKTFPCSGLRHRGGALRGPCDASVSFSAKAHWAGRGSVSKRSLVTFAKIHSVPSTGAGSGARTPGMTLEVRTRGNPQLQQGSSRPDTERDFQVSG